MEQGLNEFLVFLEAEKSYSENTIAAYRNDLGQFLDYVRHQPVTDTRDWGAIDPGIVITYILDLRDREYASSTVARKVAALKSFFHYLHDRKLITIDPTTDLDSPKVKKRLPKTLSFEDVERLLDSPPHTLAPKALRDRAILELLYASGMRVTEVVSMMVTDLDIGAGLIRCPGKNGKGRVIPIDARANRAVELYLEKGRPYLVQDSGELALFLNHRGQQLTRQGLWLIIKGYADTANLQGDVTPHTLRHSFAAHKLSRGTELRQVQQLLGHANISTTLIYTQVANGEDGLAPHRVEFVEAA